MIDYIDLLQLLREKKQLKNVKVYGRILGTMSEPASLMKGVLVDEDSVCVRVELLAINLKGMRNELESKGISNPSSIYYVNARMSTFVDKEILLNDIYALTGTLRLATRTSAPVLGMFNFYKTDSGRWGVHKTDVCDASCLDFDVNSRPYASLIEWDSTGGVSKPRDVMLLPCCYEDEPNMVKPDIKAEAMSFTDSEFVEMMPESARKQLETPSASTLNISNELKPLSDLTRSLSKECSSAKLKRKQFVKGLRSRYSISKTNQYVEYMASQIKRYLIKKPATAAWTGQMLIKEYLNSCGIGGSAKYMGIPLYKFFGSIIDEVFDFMLSGKEANLTGKGLRILNTAFSDSDKFYAGVLGRITGVSATKLISVATSCKEDGISFSKLVNSNPYLLLVISSLFTFDEVEQLALCLGLACKPEIELARSMGILYDGMYKTDSSTCFLSRALVTRQLGRTMTKARYSKIQTTGTYLTPTTQACLVAYVNKNLSIADWNYSGVVWKTIRRGEYFHAPLTVEEILRAQEYGVENGVLVCQTVGNDTWVSPYRLAEKEINVYAKVRCLYETELVDKDTVGITDDFINESIAEYELKKGFNLEPEQKEAVHLLKHNVFCITGCAGSGKTTVADCIVYTFDKWYRGVNNSNPNIKLVAPTGKAAKRMQEVLKRKAKTIHSEFLGGKSSANADLAIVDESSMIDLNLMDKMLEGIDNTRMCFIGDIEQLSPIGKGLAFKNIMRFVPTVRLGISKRSAENSTIARNANMLIANSESTNWRDLELGSDFSIIPCNESAIPDLVTKICKHNLTGLEDSEKAELRNTFGYDVASCFLSSEGIEADDIQVVSPVDKPTYIWGCHSLNSKLQVLFNPNERGKFLYKGTLTQKGTEFRIGDRVINISNSYNLVHYTKHDGGEFIASKKMGVVNGDVGKVVAVYPTQGCIFLDSNGKSFDDDSMYGSISSDIQFCGEGMFYVVVEFKDNDTDAPFYVIYYAEVLDSEDNPQRRVFTKGTLYNIHLFYAGTTHKLQGSQSKVVIAVVGNIPYNSFVTRNMVYTQITRAEEKVYLVGDVNTGSDTALARARKTLADAKTRTWGEFTCV